MKRPRSRSLPWIPDDPSEVLRVHSDLALERLDARRRPSAEGSRDRHVPVLQRWLGIQPAWAAVIATIIIAFVQHEPIKAEAAWTKVELNETGNELKQKRLELAAIEIDIRNQRLTLTLSEASADMVETFGELNRLVAEGVESSNAH